MSKFTPGPWTANRQVNKHDESLGWIINGEGCRIGWSSYATAVPNEGEKAPHPIGEANARLIAAAPDLLEACQTFAEWLRRESAGSTNEPWAGKRDTPEGEAAWREWYDENLRICELAQEQARAAIAKATGVTP